MEINRIMCTSKILTDLRFTKQKMKTKNIVKNCLQCSSCKNVLSNHKEVSFSINGTQSVRLEKGTVEINNLFKQMLIYSDFKFVLKSVKSYEGSCKRNIKITFLVVLLKNLFVLMVNLPIVLYRGENTAYKFIEAILEEYEYCKKVMNKHFNKNLTMTEEEKKKQFQLSSYCWRCENEAH